MSRAIGSIVWNWQQDAAARARARAVADARRHGLAQAGVLIGVAVLLRYAWHRALPGHVFFVAGVVVLLAALWRPLGLRPLQRLGRAVGRVVGTGLAWLLLVPFFALCIVPGGLLLRLRGSDPLARRPLAPGLTGWIARRHEPDPASLTRQFLVEDRAARGLRRPEGSPAARAWPAASGDARREPS